MSGAGHRSVSAQQGPPASLAGFPASRPAGSHWYREHGDRPSDPDQGCWYFAPLPTDPLTGGRFDLPAPHGTCYVANQPLVAALERVGRFTAQQKPVPSDLVARRVVTKVETGTLPDRLANLISERAAADFGVTGELFTMSDYTVPQDWARALHSQGHKGLHYTPRFSPHGKAIAVFEPEGPQPGPVSNTQTLRDVLDKAHVAVVDIPTSTGLRFVKTPTPRS